MSPDLQETIRTLVDILSQENEALARTDFASAVQYVPAKEAALLELSRHPQATQSKAPPTARLVESVRQLAGLAAENQILLERAVAVQIRVVQIVARAAAPPKALAHYGDNGRKAASLQTNPVALSTRL
jgi:hypothetical protein